MEDNATTFEATTLEEIYGPPEKIIERLKQARSDYNLAVKYLAVNYLALDLSPSKKYDWERYRDNSQRDIEMASRDYVDVFERYKIYPLPEAASTSDDLTACTKQ